MSESKRVPAWGYHAKHGAEVFYTEEEYEAALKTGEWFDSPAKVQKPGGSLPLPFGASVDSLPKPAVEKEPAAEEGKGDGEEEYKPKPKMVLMKMKDATRRAYAVKWFGAEYAADLPDKDVIADILRRQKEKAEL